MLKICLKKDANGEPQEVLNLPVHLSEISSDWFDAVASKIIPADHYSLIALVGYEKLSTLKASKSKSTGVLPLFIKGSGVASPFVSSIPTGTPIITVSSVLERAIHVNIKQNTLSPINLMNIINNNVEVSKGIFTEYSVPIVIVEFKLIADCDIYGIYPKNTEFNPVLESTFHYITGSNSNIPTA